MNSIVTNNTMYVVKTFLSRGILLNGLLLTMEFLMTDYIGKVYITLTYFIMFKVKRSEIVGGGTEHSPGFGPFF